MPSASPALLDVLNQWGRTRVAVRRQAEIETDWAREGRLPVDDTARELERIHRSEVTALEESSNQLATRWVERLRRLEQWKATVDRRKAELAELNRLSGEFVWFQKAGSMSGAFSRRLLRRADALDEVLASCQEMVTDWIAILAERQSVVAAFRARQAAKGTALLVSRGRKQPETAFVDEQGEKEQWLYGRLEVLRLKLDAGLNRLYKASRALEHHAAVHPAVLEPHRTQLLEPIKHPLQRLLSLRQRTLDEIARFEDGRRTLSFIREGVNEMHCVEDVYRRKEPLWKRLFKSGSPTAPGR